MISVNSHIRTAILATTHCLIGCSIGEVLGMVLATYFALNNFSSIILSVLLAFAFGYSLTLIPLLRHGLETKKALRIAVASDTVSISTMELMDNLVIVLIPAALSATLSDPLFWQSLIISLIVAFLVTVPVNYFMIKRGLGHSSHQMH